MPSGLWGATETIGLALPTAVSGYSLLLAYLFLIGGLFYYYRQQLQAFTTQDWTLTAVLSLSGLFLSQFIPFRFVISDQLAPLSVAQNPVTVLVPFAAVPLLLAGARLPSVGVLLVGLATGFGRSLGQSHYLYDIFHYALIGWLMAGWLTQAYRGWVAQILRQPIVAGLFGHLLFLGLTGLALFAEAGASLNALDLALSTMKANLFPLLGQGMLGGVVTAVILHYIPSLWRQTRAVSPYTPPLHLFLVPPPRALTYSQAQLSLRHRLLTNFVQFAILLTGLVVIVLFTVSANLATRLVLNQMAQDAIVVSEQIPDFQRELQTLLRQYEADGELLNENSSSQTLRQLYRARPFYRRLVLVDLNQEVSAFFPSDVEVVELTALEQTAVAQALSTAASDIASAESRNDEFIVSFVVPVFDDQAEPVAALVGRVPYRSLENLIVGLQGVVGQGEGFVVDEAGRIIAHPDPTRLLTNWTAPAEAQRLNIDPQLAGLAYQGRNSQTNARQLVYTVKANDPAWRVVLNVPYDVALSLAVSIGWPIAGVLLLFALAFYWNLNRLGRDFTQPVTELVQATRDIAQGGSLNKPIPTKRHDELGQLGRAFAQLQRALKHRLDELSLLLGVSQDVSTSIDISYSLPIILRGALRGTGANGGRALLVNPGGGAPLTFDEGHGSDLAHLDRLIMKELRTVDELVLDSPRRIRRLFGSDAPQTIGALLAVPLRLHNRQLGMMWLSYQTARSITESERNLLQTLAGQASVVVENARLYATAEGGRRRLAAVLASTSEPVIVTDQTNRVLLINRAMERSFDLRNGEVMGRAVADVIVVPELVEALTEDDTQPRNLEFLLEDGRTFFTNASTIMRHDGQVMGRVSVLHDITHYKEIDQMKSDFVSTVSHDLRSPLTFMRGYGTMLPMVGELNDKQKEYIEKILSGIDQMAKLVDDLLDLGRIEASLEVKQDPIQIKPLLADIGNEYWQHARFSGIDLKVELPASLPYVRGDESLLRQAITNLVSNGIKYAPDSGDMHLTAKQTNGEVIISVADNGPGIPQDAQMRLFEKFYRVQQRGTEKVKGSGLGLAIVRSVVERHGGRVWCHSEEGQGSTFSVALPIPEK